MKWVCKLLGHHWQMMHLVSGRDRYTQFCSDCGVKR